MYDQNVIDDESTCEVMYIKFCYVLTLCKTRKQIES